MSNTAAVKPHFSFVLAKTRQEYCYTKTMRALLRRIESGTYHPTLISDQANELFRSVVLMEHDPAKYEYKWPHTLDEWNEILAKPFEQASLSRNMFFSRNYNTGERLAEPVRAAHQAMIKRGLQKINIIEDWFYHHRNELRQIVANF